MEVKILNNAPTMSSLEIAELTGKRHEDVLRDIRKTMDEAEIEATHFCVPFKMPSGQTATVYKLPRRECDLVVSGYSVKYRLAIIDRWHELEAEKVAPIIEPPKPPTPLEIEANLEAMVRVSEKVVLKNKFPLIYQATMDGMQNAMLAMVGGQKLIGSSVKAPKDVMEIAKDAGLHIPQNMKGNAGKYVKKHYVGEISSVERVIMGSMRHANAYSDYKQVEELLKEFLK